VSSNIYFSSPRMPANAVVVGCLCLLIVAGVYFVARGEYEGDKAEAPEASSTSGQTPALRAQTQTLLPTDAGAAQASLAVASADDTPVNPFTPEEAAENLRAFFDKVMKLEDLSSTEVDELQARLLASIESNPAVTKVVEQFYHNMPGERGMERDMLRSLLVVSPAGRSIVLQEANSIWENKSEAKFAEMYETYFNLPGQAPMEVVDRALADLKEGSQTDERTAVARLNFIGSSLEDWRNGNTANLRSDAISLLNQLAENKDSEVVRALAVQKLYRMSTPAEASNIAIMQLSKGVDSELVRETLNAVSSGDVELTPNLRIALTTAVKRPSASAEEQQQLSQVLGSH
jgi:hypothetical protein